MTWGPCGATTSAGSAETWGYGNVVPHAVMVPDRMRPPAITTATVIGPCIPRPVPVYVPLRYPESAAEAPDCVPPPPRRMAAPPVPRPLPAVARPHMFPRW